MTSVAPAMRFSVDQWDPSYGTSVDAGLVESEATVELDVETPADSWAAVARTDVVHTGPVLFVDGVRRIDARAWISDPTVDKVATSATPALCASYAAGVMCCCDGRSHLLAHGVRHRLVTLVGHAQDVVTSAGTYTTLRTSAGSRGRRTGSAVQRGPAGPVQARSGDRNQRPRRAGRPHGRR